MGSYKKGTALSGCVVSDVVVMFQDLPTGTTNILYGFKPVLNRASINY